MHDRARVIAGTRQAICGVLDSAQSLKVHDCAHAVAQIMREIERKRPLELTLPRGRQFFALKVHDAPKSARLRYFCARVPTFAREIFD